ncbi:hypothetical protein M427DRAFT_65057 [Gonapodya prolifera JEL478]|uniref:Uncharacterized protein n=1 Tax=Gonapodya prolifera (strain JEL478) TaxID=1344416 RepID=A0A138ZWN2_GONPJ|nr:hypothetical protein M427DRAFT_65057 [Gonapodya prolifera JEL478]|eukprot:KXS08907.1 hypothetical protein M427DRAFT_65057 [Gonapodya prolifera JEL478]
MSPNKRASLPPSERGQQLDSDASSQTNSMPGSESEHEYVPTSVSGTLRNESPVQSNASEVVVVIDINTRSSPSTSSADKGKAAISETKDGTTLLVASTASSPKAVGGTEDTREVSKKGDVSAGPSPPKTTRKSPPTSGKGVESLPAATGKGFPKTPIHQSSSMQVNFDNMLNAFGQMSISHSTFRRSAIDGSPVAVGPGFSPNGDKYVSARGNIFHTSSPPPRPCFNCGDNHWRKDCPWGRRY